MLSYNDAAAENMKHFIYHDAHGYSQYERQGDGGYEIIQHSDGTQVKLRTGDRDCSSGGIDCYESLGVSCGGASYTGDMLERMLASGNFILIDPCEAENGDILLRKGHTEMCLYHDGQYWQAGFRISELGTIYGEVGDQTGWEATESPLDVDAWTWCLRCVAVRENPVPPEPQPSQPASEPLNGYGFSYRAHVQNLGWCNPVRDGQIAGSVGFGARLEAIKITPIADMDLDVMLHEQDKGDIWYRGIGLGKHDPVIGTEGESRRVEGFQINVTMRDGSAKDKIVYYRGHLQDVGWTGWTREGNYCGTRGEGRRLEAVQIMLVIEQEASDPRNNNGLQYRAHTQDYGWQPTVRDGQTAGTTGQSRRVEALQFMTIPENLAFDVYEHIQNIGDISYNNVSTSNMPVMGTVGKGLRMEGFAIHAIRNGTGKEIRYQAHIENLGWTKVCKDGEFCGTRGKSLRVEAVRIWLE